MSGSLRQDFCTRPWGATSGALGGSFGLAALPMKLPISTIIMLRSIGDVARAEREDLTNPETALNCLQAFALGGLTGQGDAGSLVYRRLGPALLSFVAHRQCGDALSPRGA